ncbi:hypothetical protein MJ581_06200 [Escherichia coli]|nr:hypothetical protein MJ581_06200 [Escherichia coli]
MNKNVLSLEEQPEAGGEVRIPPSALLSGRRGGFATSAKGKGYGRHLMKMTISWC